MHNAKTAPLLAMPESGWSKVQQRFLAVLEQEENRTKTATEICQLAGYASKDPWYRALRDERFAAVIDAFGIKGKCSYGRVTEVQQRLLEVLQQDENRRKPVVEIRFLDRQSFSSRTGQIVLPTAAHQMESHNLSVRFQPPEAGPEVSPSRSTHGNDQKESY